MANKNYAGQMTEYQKNKDQLEKILGEHIFAVSYPCNSYNADTFRCMRELGMTIGFRANMAEVCLEEFHLEYPREDHANIIREMKDAK